MLPPTKERNEGSRSKLVVPRIKVVDADKGIAEAVVSDETIDRHGDRIQQSGWDLAPFRDHPVLVAGHDYGDVRSQIGEWTEMAVRGRQLVGTVRYYIAKGNADADWGFEIAKLGRAAFSVGFIPDYEKAVPIDKDGTLLKNPDDSDRLWGPLEFRGQELLEVSHVVVPANRNGLQRMKGLDPKLDAIVADLLDELPDEIAPLEASAPDDVDYEAIADLVVARLAPELRALYVPTPEPTLEPEPIDYAATIRDAFRLAAKEVLR